MHKNAYFFALSAASAAAVVAAPEIAQAVCECTLGGIAPTVIKSQGAETFRYGGSPSAGYDAVIVQDNRYGFTGDRAPKVYFDYYLSGTGTHVTNAQIFRVSYLGTQIGSGTLLQQSYTCTSGACGKEMGPISVANTWGVPSATFSAWDVIKVHVSGSSVMNPRWLPSQMVACW